MAAIANAPEAIEEIRKVRQARLYEPTPVPDDVLAQLLEVARWTGSGRNTQPWEFIVITDKEQLRELSEIRPPINWLADAPLGIALVMKNQSAISEAFDEGRLTERLLIAARLLGLGGGTAWFGDEEQQARGNEILGVPSDRLAKQVVAIGYPTTLKDHRPNANIGGRKPLSELVSRDRYGAK